MTFPSLQLFGFLVFGLLTAAPSPAPVPVPGWKAETGTDRSRSLKDVLATVDGSLKPELRRAKDDELAGSAFQFFRGTAYLFHRDLASQKLIEASRFNNPGTATWVQGDVHALNFGSFDDDQGNVIYDLNDFDEAWVASYLRDVWRAAVSIALVSRSAHLSKEDADAAVNAFAGSYLDTLESFRGNDHEKQAEITVAEAQPPLKEFLGQLGHDSGKSRKAMLDKWTKVDNKVPFLKNKKNLEPAKEDEKQALTAAIAVYKDKLSSGLKGNAGYFTVVDAARRINAGTGSLGTPRFYVLIQGPSPSLEDDRILDVKQQGMPSVQANLSGAEKGNRIPPQYATKDGQGCRVAAAQRALLTRVDDHLGCLPSMLGSSWSVRERSPFKDDLEDTLASLPPTKENWQSLARQWGKVLATDHARGNLNADLILSPGRFKEAVHGLTQGHRDDFSAEVRGFALAYASQVETDFNLFLELRKAHEIP
jgi:uncharacterized protein (DUF2252 family)